MVLTKCKKNQLYEIMKINSDEETKSFLFTLGCYEGEHISVVSKLATTFVVNLKDGRYGIDDKIAKNIIVDG